MSKALTRNTRVVVTRSGDDSQAMAILLRELGIEAIELPAISFAEPMDWAPVDNAIAALDSFDWVIFTSGTTVERFLLRTTHHPTSKAALKGCSIAAIGPSTSNTLRKHGLRPDLIPSVHTSQGLLKELAPRVTGTRMLLPRGDIADPALPIGLMEAGAQVVDVIVYRTLSPPQLRKEALRVMEEGVDMVSFTSASTVRNLATALGSNVSLLKTIPAAVIGPITARAARETGLSVAVKAADTSISGLVAAIQSWITQREEGYGH